MKRVGKVVNRALTDGRSIAWRDVQGAIQLAVAQHRPHVAAGFLVRDELDELIGVVGARATEPAGCGRGASVVGGDCSVRAVAEAAQQLLQVRGAEVESRVGYGDPVRGE